MVEFDRRNRPCDAAALPLGKLGAGACVQSTIWNDAPWAFLVTEDVTGASVKTLKNFRLRPDSSYDFYEAEIVK